MPLPRRTIAPVDARVARGLHEIRVELEVPDAFPNDVLAEAAAATVPDDAGRVDRRDLPMVTIDPPGSRDLDQALAIEAGPSGGHVVWYAIADVAAFVVPGGAVDRESHARGVTLYAPDRTAPLHPSSLSAGAASLLPGQDRPAVLWRLSLDPDGALIDTTVGRATVRSRRQLTYAEAEAAIGAGDEVLAPLAVVGRQRLAIEAERGGLSLPVPEQEIIRRGGSYSLEFRAARPVEQWNAQLSLLCGMAAADLMLAGGWGFLRTLPPADDAATASLRRHARALGIAWSEEDQYRDVVARIDPTEAGGAAFLVQATRLFRGADYLPLRPGESTSDDVLVHAAIAAPYAHVTAPLRRLGDRYATECVLAVVRGDEPPAWATDRLDAVRDDLRGGMQRAGALDRAVVDHVEALVLADRIGEEFAAVVVDERRSGAVVQFLDPAVVGVVDAEVALGDEVVVRVDAADPVARTVDLRLVGS